MKRNRERKGGTVSDHILVWQEFTFLITNLPEETASTKLIGTIYRLRWSIELIFKNWKSHLQLDVLQGTRPERIEVFLYVKMIGILLLGMICNHLKIKVLKMLAELELSETKVAKFLISLNVFSGLFRGYLRSEVREFMDDEYWSKQFCKQKRRRRTTLERVKSQEPFWAHQALA